MKYQIVTTWSSIKNLEERVNKLIEKGWKPIGGIAVASFEENLSKEVMVEHLYQAMVKDE